jgi:hypothetical protein
VQGNAGVPLVLVFITFLCKNGDLIKIPADKSVELSEGLYVDIGRFFLNGLLKIK